MAHNRLWVYLLALCVGMTVYAGIMRPESAGPVIECGVEYPTADKPQSKVWFAAGSWWAWLPSANGGSTVWRRGADGRWRMQEHLDADMAKLPGRADVYAEGALAVAALCAGDAIAVTALQWSEQENNYRLLAPPLTLRERGEVETVTIDRDKAGFFWIAYPADSADTRRIITRIVSPSFDRIGPPVVLADDVKQDDICAISSINGAVGVLWSNQHTQQILFTRHQPGTPVGEWWPPDTVASGNETADDHLNLCRPGDGEESMVKIFAATKTSLDKEGKPLLAARVFGSDWKWVNVDFAVLQEKAEPSRPVALWLGDHPAVAYTVYGAQNKEDRENTLELQHFSPDGLRTVGEPVRLLSPIWKINDITGPKREPEQGPVLLLASDKKGRVWEMFAGQGE